MRATATTSVLLSLLGCAALFPHSASAQLSERLERCLPSPTFEQEVSDVRAARGARSIEVDELSFDGPTHMPEAERVTLLRKLKATLSTDDGDGVQQQGYEIEGWWRDHGYFRADFRIQAVPTGRDDAYQHVILKVHVDEGAQYRMGAVSFRSSEPEEPLVFSERRLMQTVHLRDGDIFSSLQIRKTLDALKDLYSSHGYIDFVATPITEVNESTHRIDLTMEIDQQKQFRLGKIEVITADPRVRAAVNAAVKPGDIFDASTLRRVLKENASLLPADVSVQDVDFHRDTTRGIVDLRFNLETCSQAPPQ